MKEEAKEEKEPHKSAFGFAKWLKSKLVKTKAA